MKKVGIIGNGFVGNAIYQNFKDKIETRVYDINPDKSVDALEEVLASDFIFVCLPTPMGQKGKCNLSFVDDFFEHIPTVDGIFILKSTVPVGTTERLIKSRPDLKIIHSPEFLTAVNAAQDFANSDRHIFGGYLCHVSTVELLFVDLFPQIPTHTTTSNESETIKYFANCYLASKIAFFNNLYETCEKLGLSYESVRHGVCLDKRIGDSHSIVPGPDGQFGFGGYCFPKDINSFIHVQNDNDIDSSLFKAVLNYNNKIRV